VRVAEIWRYPVKTMAGEKLQRVGMGPLGIEGDRVVHVECTAHRRRSCGWPSSRIRTETTWR
jgi:hypothetical protein